MEPRKDRPATTRRPRHLVLIVAAALAFVLGVTGAWAALRDAGSTQAAPTIPVATVTPEPTAPTSSPTEPPREPSPAVEPTSEPTVEPIPVDPYALADGTYPAYMRKVVVEPSTIRVDVIQVFFDDQARREARKDGMSWKDSRYTHLYLRNENPMLRTLPVAVDARIEFVGGCVAENTLVGMRDLYRASTPFTDGYYYDLVVSDGTVIDVTQHYSTEGC